jgi:hypothetical protein
MKTEIFDEKMKAEIEKAESLELSKYLEVALITRY